MAHGQPLASIWVNSRGGDCCTDRRQVGHAAFVAGVVMMVSYSMGVNSPRRACRRRRPDGARGFDRG